ncbi:hypothetical protein F0521_22370 [Ferrimonas sp. YFM]|nr:hypothetical protein F0521_22370 [Ferrimonas sp. YFM]
MAKTKEGRAFLKESVYKDLLAADESLPFDAHYGFAIGSILGHRHPYFYDRGRSIMKIAYSGEESPKALSSLVEEFEDYFPQLRHCGQSGDANYRSGVYIPKENIEQVIGVFSKIPDYFQDDDGLKLGLNYALKHGTGLLEVMDLVVPITDQFFSCPYNFKAGFLGNAFDETKESDCTCTSFTIGIPVPSSSVLDIDEMGGLVMEWIEQEKRLPALKETSQQGRTIAGWSTVKLLSAEESPIVIIMSEDNILLRDAEQFCSQLTCSLSEFFSEKSIKANFFVSTHDAEALPEELLQNSPCDIRYKNRPRIALQQQELLFAVDGHKIDLSISISGKASVFHNGVLVDSYKLKRSTTHRTCLFFEGNWYNLSVRRLSMTSPILEVNIFKGMFCHARFKLVPGSETLSKSFDRTLRLGEKLLPVFVGVTFAVPRLFIIPLIVLLLLMLKFNRRHHFYLVPESIDSDK